MLKRIYKSQSKTIAFSAFLIAFSGLLSRFLGLIRDRLLAGRFGAGEELDVYFAAFRIPDLVYGMLIAGGITAAFLPVFSEYFKGDSTDWQAQTKLFVNNVLNTFFILLIAVCFLLAIFAPFIINIIIPGFSAEGKETAVMLTRIMLFSPLFFGLSSIFSGILHYFNRFLAYSLAPIMYNLGIIFGIVFLEPIFGIAGVAYGVVLGALLHLLIQVPAAIVSGYSYSFVLNFNFPGIRKIFKLMIPRTMGIAANHINLIVITAIASTLAIGSITIFNFANNLHYVPIGVIGFSFAISTFPSLSKSFVSGQKESFFRNLSSSIRHILFLIIPLSFLMFVLRAQIVRLVLGTGEFGWIETRLTAASLGIFCIGLFAGGLIPLLTKAFFALQDTRTPVLISVFSMAVNILFAFFFIYLLKDSSSFLYTLTSKNLKLENIPSIEVVGLPLALSLSALIHLFLLLFFLYRKTGDFGIENIYYSTRKILISSILMVFSAYLSLRFFSEIIDMQTFAGVLVQAGASALIGLLVYIIFSYILNSSELKAMTSSIFKQFIK